MLTMILSALKDNCSTNSVSCIVFILPNTLFSHGHIESLTKKKVDQTPCAYSVPSLEDLYPFNVKLIRGRHSSSFGL